MLTEPNVKLNGRINLKGNISINNRYSYIQEI